jgi:hypothetical protein
MTKIINWLKGAAAWIIGKAEEIEKLNAKTRAELDKRTRRLGLICFGVGVVAGVVLATIARG